MQIRGDLDIAAEDLFESELRATLAAPVDHIVIDLRTLAFMDLTGVRLLLNAYGRSFRDDVELSIVNTPVGSVARLLHLTRMDKVLPLVNEPPRLTG